MKKRPGRLVILSGPSCVGKSPLAKALARFHPDIWQTLRPVVLYNSRAPRPGEKDGVDYHFRSHDGVQRLEGKEDFVVMDVRGDLQALDLAKLMDSLATSNVFFEGNPYVGRTLQTHPALAEADRLSVFMSPLAREEILVLKGEAQNVSLSELVTDVMRRKLLRRTRRQKNDLSLKDLENIERRASSAYRELKEAHFFDHIIPNHDGEDSENWDAFYYPLGDARKALVAFVSLLEGKRPPGVEHWESDLIE